MTVGPRGTAGPGRLDRDREALRTLALHPDRQGRVADGVHLEHAGQSPRRLPDAQSWYCCPGRQHRQMMDDHEALAFRRAPHDPALGARGRAQAPERRDVRVGVRHERRDGALLRQLLLEPVGPDALRLERLPGVVQPPDQRGREAGSDEPPRPPPGTPLAGRPRAPRLRRALTRRAPRRPPRWPTRAPSVGRGPPGAAARRVAPRQRRRHLRPSRRLASQVAHPAARWASNRARSAPSSAPTAASADHSANGSWAIS